MDKGYSFPEHPLLMNKSMRKSLNKYIDSFSTWLNWIAGLGLAAMLLITIADIFGIKVFKAPVPGAIEIVGFMGAIITAFAIAHTYLRQGHIKVEFIVMRLSTHAQNLLSIVVSFLSLALFIVIAWQSFEFGRVLQKTGEVSMTQGIPFYPLVYAISFCALAVCLVLIAEIINLIMKLLNK